MRLVSVLVSSLSAVLLGTVTAPPALAAARPIGVRRSAVQARQLGAVLRDAAQPAGVQNGAADNAASQSGVTQGGAAQSGATLSGRVLDPTGGPLPGVTVTLTAPGQPPQVAVTDATGAYRFAATAAGRYQLSAELAGFRPHVVPDLDLAADRARTLDVTLAVGGVSESVTVLGDRAGRSLRDTASSVEVFDANTLEQRPGLTSANELLNGIPNVTSTGTTNLAPAVRGVDGTGPAQGADAFFAGTRARLNVQVDGRPSSYNEVVFGDAGFWDVEQVEVFRGAQSTLQGRNAVAGSVVIKTKDPSYTREAEVRVGGGSFSTGQIAAVASGPLVANQLAYRVSFDRGTSDSFVKGLEGYPGVSDPGAYESMTLRGKLLWEPKAVPGLRNLVTFAHARHTAPQVETVSRPFDQHESNYPMMPIFEPRSTSAIVDTRWKATEQVTFENTFSVTGTDIFRRATPGDGNAEIDGRELVLEPRVRVVGLDKRLHAFGGLYLFRAQQDEWIDLFGGGTFNDKTRTVAVFGEATYSVQPRVDITLGGRYEQEHRRRLGSAGPFAIDFDATYKVFSPKLGVTWRTTDQVTLGVAAARGYNGGSAGFTYEPPFVSYTFRPEFVWNYEAFGRADVMEGRLSLTANVFYSDFTDMQLPFDLNPDPAIWSFVIRNADAARTYGAEIGAKWFGIPGLELRAGGGLLKTEITRYPGSSVEGHELARAPAFTSSLGATWRHASGLDASADARFTDAYYSQITNDPRGKTDPYWMVNAQAGYTFGRARLSAVIANLFDTQNAVLIEPGDTVADDGGTLMRPRSVSLNLRVGF